MMRSYLKKSRLAILTAGLFLTPALAFGQAGAVPSKPLAAIANHRVLDPAGKQAQIEVEVDPKAEVWIEGKKMSQSGDKRQFVTPPLAAGYNFDYEIRARWKVDGKDIERLRTIRFRAGDQVAVSFHDAENDGEPTIVSGQTGTPVIQDQFGGGPVAPTATGQGGGPATGPVVNTVIVPGGGGVGGIPLSPFDPFNRNRNRNRSQDPFRTGINDPRAQVPTEGTPQTPGSGRTQSPDVNSAPGQMRSQNDGQIQSQPRAGTGQGGQSQPQASPQTPGAGRTQSPNGTGAAGQTGPQNDGQIQSQPRPAVGQGGQLQNGGQVPNGTGQQPQASPQTPGTGQVVPPTPGAGSPQTPGTGVTSPANTPSQPGAIQSGGSPAKAGTKGGSVRPAGKP